MSDIYSSIHIIVPRPTVKVNPETYPSLGISEGVETSLIVSINGDGQDRHAFAQELRRAADFFESWTEADGVVNDAPERDEVPA